MYFKNLVNKILGKEKNYKKSNVLEQKGIIEVDEDFCEVDFYYNDIPMKIVLNKNSLRQQMGNIEKYALGN